ncbi:MAG: hypothetical protein N2691_05620 [Patescibacteria group bacterium]|nr:hypothetical protein [Patescibacteria group bacterium]
MTIRFLAGLSVLLAAGILAAGIVTSQEAATDQSLEVSPPVSEISAEPGEVKTITTTIRNKGTYPVPITVRVDDFVAEGEEGQVALMEAGAGSVSVFTTVEPESFKLDAGASREVTATIAVPKDAVGGKYGAIVFSVDAEQKNVENTMTGISQEVASLFLLRVGGQATEKLTITSFAVPGFSESGPIAMKLSFKNTGNVHSKPYGLVNVTDMFGQKVADIVVPPTNIFPGATRTITVNLDKRFLVGSYTATAAIQYGTDTQQAINAQASFTVIPYRLLAVAAIVGFILWKGRKRVRKALKAIFK